ncbi:MAG: FHA domain-containing protein [Oculatellaceae cyanobacterium bins.114]|nr:FHA domain-containing protein [Oculatellaceae cyanobacterium bins.114]
MVVKADKLAQTIAELQSTITAHSQTDARFQPIGRSLETTATILKTGKLSLHIISHYAEAAQILLRFLRASQTLTEKYYITVAAVPQEWSVPVESDLTNILLLPISADQQHEFHLTATQPLAIGRHPKCQVFIPDPYLLVSGHHADLQPTSDAVTPGWQICDRSRNGTFVNGHRIEDWQTLEDGDQITLGSPFPTETCPTLIFESHRMEAEYPSSHAVLDCDVVCFVFDAERSLSNDEKNLLEQASQVPLIKWMAIAMNGDAPISNEADWVIPIGVTDLRSRLHPSTHPLSVEEWSLSLQTDPVAAHSKPDQSKLEVAKRHPDKQLEKLIKSLESLVRRKPEDLLAKRLALQVAHQSEAIEALLKGQAKRLHIEQTWDQLRLNSSHADAPQTILETRLKPIEDDLLSLFKQMRERLPQAKSRLLDDYLESSILNRIQQFVHRLQACVVQQHGKKLLQLKPPASTAMSAMPKRAKIRRRKSRLVVFQTRSQVQREMAAPPPDNDANTALICFCRNELTQWADQEWREFLMGNDIKNTKGAVDLLEDLRAVLTSHGESLDDLSLQITSPDYTPVFDEIFTKPLDSTRYQEPHPFFHILKKVRNQWMQFLFMFSFLSVLGIAGRKQIMQHLTAPIAVAFHAAPWIASVVTGGVLLFVIKLLMQWYRDDRDTEREEEAKKLRQGLTTHYQALVKNRLTDKIVQRLIVALDTEEQKLRELLQSLKPTPKGSVAKIGQGQGGKIFNS